MKCIVCEREGLKSSLHQLPWQCAAYASDHFWDEAGVEHHHDPNVYYRVFKCSRDHTFHLKSQNPCAAIVGMDPQTGMILCEFGRVTEVIEEGLPQS